MKSNKINLDKNEKQHSPMYGLESILPLIYIGGMLTIYFMRYGDPIALDSTAPQQNRDTPIYADTMSYGDTIKTEYKFRWTEYNKIRK